MTEFEPTSPDSPDMEPSLGSPGLDERRIKSLIAQHIADIFKNS